MFSSGSTNSYIHLFSFWLQVCSVNSLLGCSVFTVQHRRFSIEVNVYLCTCVKLSETCNVHIGWDIVLCSGGMNTLFEKCVCVYLCVY